MSGSYDQLLEATARHLEQLKSRGTRFVSVSPATLQALGRHPARPKATAAPTQAPAAQSSTRVFTVPPAAAPAPATPVVQRPASVVVAPVHAGSSKEVALAEIRDRAMQCVKCPHLARTRTNVVFGVGSADAEIMFVGEAPGADEDLQGEPFVGMAGQLLTKMIQTMGLSREQVYIANILKCRPDRPPGSSGNRKPTPDEMQTCIPYLHAQIDIIKPKVLVALGATAMEGLLAVSGISKLRGHWHSYRGIPLMPTYHPAYLLRNQSIAEKRKVWEDLLAVMEKVGMPISEKQRSYFLTKG